MAWVAGLGAFANAVAGMDANSRAEDFQNKQLGFQQQELDWRKQQYRDEQALFGPMRGKLVNLASSDDPLYWGETKDQIDQNFADGFRSAEENAMRTGTLDSNLKKSWDTNAMLTKASILSKAWLQGKKDKNSLALALLGRDNSAALGSRVGDTSGSGARLMGDISNQWAGNARNAWAGASSGAASAAELYSKNDGWT